MALLNLRNLRKKYRNLRRQGQRQDQIYGPRLLPTNFVLDGWTQGLGGYFTRHGNRRFGEASVSRLLRALHRDTQQRGTLSWVVELGPTHLRPEFLYSHLRQRFPYRSPEGERRWVARLRRRLLAQQAAATAVPELPDRLTVDPLGGSFRLDTPLEELSLELAHHDQLSLLWDSPGRLLLTPTLMPTLG